jgi:glycosyltransferase 2 family protein
MTAIQNLKNKKPIFNKIIRIIGICIVALSFIYIIWIGYSNWRDIRQTVSIQDKIIWLVIGILGYMLILTLLALAWKRSLHLLGKDITYRDSYIVFNRSLISKYLPGNVFQYVGRFLLGRNIGISDTTLVSSIILETLIQVAASIILVLSFNIILGWVYKFNNLTLVLSAVFIILSIVIILILKYSSKTRQWLFKKPWFIQIRTINVKSLLIGSIPILLIYFVFLLASGFLFWFLSITIFEINFSNSIPIFIGAYIISWTIGYITPGAPGGLGIREAILISILSPYMPGAKALSISIIFRLITIVGEVLIFITTYFFKGTRIRKPPD